MTVSEVAVMVVCRHVLLSLTPGVRVSFASFYL